jgi:hypothetical protein
MTAREKEALIENAIKESNIISEECKQELLKYYKKKKLYMKNGVFSLEGDKKTYEDMIFELQDENQTLKDNWDKLKEFISYENISRLFDMGYDVNDFINEIDDKIKELEKVGNNETA